MKTKHLLLIAAVLCAPMGGAVAGADQALGFIQGTHQDQASASACAAVPAVTVLLPPPPGAQASCVTHWWVCGSHDTSITSKSVFVGSLTLSGQSNTRWGSATSACGPELIVQVIGVEGRTVAAEAGAVEAKIRAEDHFDSFVADSTTINYVGTGRQPALPCGAVSTHSAQVVNVRWSASAASGCANDRLNFGLDLVDVLLQ